MKLRQFAVLGLVGMSLVGCKKKTPAEGPVPTVAADAGTDRERMRADSIAAVEAREREARERAMAAEMARTRAALTEMIFFDYDSEGLTPEAEARLRGKAEILRSNPGVELRVEGHADQRGSTEYNLALAQRRAESVRIFLSNYGISPDRISTVSYGKERPLVDMESEDAYAQNRRAEFVVTAGDAGAAGRGR